MLNFLSAAYFERFGGYEYEYSLFLPEINGLIEMDFEDTLVD